MQRVGRLPVYIVMIQQLPCSLLTVKHENVLEGLHEEDIQTIRVLFAEGRALLAAQSYEAALSKFDRVLARNPFDAAVLEARAETCEKLGQTSEASRCRHRVQALRKES